MMKTQSYKLEKPVTLHTDGKGLWSDVKGEVPVRALHLRLTPYLKGEMGELCVVYDTQVWKDEFGLVYTDKLFLAELQTMLVEMGLSDDLDYSEQGMQGGDYVSLDVGSKFIQKWDEKFGNFRLTSEDLDV